MPEHDYSLDTQIGSGLLSQAVPAWMAPLRRIAERVQPASFNPSLSGYKGWASIVRNAQQRKPHGLVLVGHSNYNFATTSIAAALAPAGIKCAIVCLDRTLKRCPPVGANVVAVLDIWAQLEVIRLAPTFAGTYERLALPRQSHIGVLSDPLAETRTIEFVQHWQKVFGIVP